MRLSRPFWPPRLWKACGLAAILVGLGLGASPARRAEAASKRAKPHAKAKPAPALKACAPPKDDTPPIVPGAKVAVLAFSGDDVEPVRRQVMHVLHAKGLKTVASLRPVDSAEQYREMATALGLVAYVDGEVDVDGAAGSATVFVRSGATGLRVASATIAGDRRQLPADIGKQLWAGVRAALGQACADAAKPRKGEREPMRINAGTPITDAPEATD